jgi:uncharacterized protein
MTDVPEDIAGLIDTVQYEEISEIPVEHGYIWTSCASVENGNPIFWDRAAATEITAGPIAPPSMVSVWFRPHHWAPGRVNQALPLQVHFDLKQRFVLPEAVMTDNTIVFHEPVRIGDLLRTHQVLRSVSGPKTTKLGTGRFWVIEVVYRNQNDGLVAVETYTGFGYQRSESTQPRATPGDSVERSSTDAGECSMSAASSAGSGEPFNWSKPRVLVGDVVSGSKLPELSCDVTATTVVLGALATRDWRPMHHDKDFAVNRNGTRDIFLNTPNQAAWFERYITDWSGPHGRLGRIKFRMRGSVFPGDTMTFRGTVEGVTEDDDGCGWAELALELVVGDDLATSAAARIALPVTPDDNPWTRGPDSWKP